ncbi:MAG: primosomal protein N' [Lachnospiraceae bacterium]|nr:primosomal protein N' [Lachnospiraceae bacterium]
MFADVIVDISVEALDRTFQYKIPENLEGTVIVGSRVRIPFGRGNREISGFVVGISDAPKIPVEKIKDLSAAEDAGVSVEEQLLKLAAWMKNRYGATMNEALKTVLPIKKKIKSVEEHWLNFASSEEEVKKELDRCRLRHFKAKARLLQGMFEEGGQMTTKTAAKKYGITKSVIDGMVKAGILSVTDRRFYRNPMEAEERKGPSAITLNDEQQKIADDFSEEYEKGIRRTYLLYGVTGSGKTEVYMEMIDRVLSQDLQVIVLIPEISLTYQTVKRFQNRFGNRVSILNSRMSEGERFDQYERAKKGEADIMVGPRSALFVPFSRLGLIIMDEEHETSYKSENPPKYHAREAAIKRAEMSGASVVLGSATPSVESYRMAKEGDYKLYRLFCRAGEAEFPTVHTVDLREELKAGNRSVFSRLLQEKIEDRLQKKEQIILFLNRRGYAGFVSCRSCGYVLKCTHCEVSMTAHKNHVGDVDTLICHYCGHAVAMPERCPSCGSPYIAAFGLGTQKVEEMLQKRFPGAKILRMDGDTTSGKHGHEAVLKGFREGKADILIGTQMIVKGHDFPNVTLVAALAADLSMYAGDYRSNERTFQLLMQASGRAGRGKKQGEMIIQTYHPEQYCVEAVQTQQAELFYENELAYRRMTEYPPFSQMLAVLVLSESKEEAKACITRLSEEIVLGYRDSAAVIGPAEAGLSRAKDRYRYSLYVKCREEKRMEEIKNEIDKFSRDRKWEKLCSIQYDVNPLSGY